MAISPNHYNHNLICAIDCETTGLNAGTHDLIEICILPLNPDYTPSKQFKPFNIRMQPKYGGCDEKLTNRHDLVEAMNNGLDPDRAEMRLREWFEKLNLRFRKKIVPLGHNYSNHDRNFIIDWLGGSLCYEEFFMNQSRDPMQLALGINDMSDMANEIIPFPHCNLSYLCNVLGFKRETREGGRHSAIMDCIAAAECYRRLLKYHHYAFPGAAATMQKQDHSSLEQECTSESNASAEGDTVEQDSVS